MTEIDITSTSAVTLYSDNVTNSSQPFHPWTDKSEGHKVVEVIYLFILTGVGTIGNLIVILSIALERRIHTHGNVFVVNLAVADLLVTGFVIPTVIANIISGKKDLSNEACFVAGYTVTVTCTCSLCNLTFIAVNRYYAVVRRKSYVTTFTRKKVYVMIAASWVWSNLLSSPTFLGWGRIAYDPKMELCTWDDTFSQSYTIFLTSFAVLLPLIIIFFCYFKLFTTVRSSGKWFRDVSARSKIKSRGANEQSKRSIRKERNLLHTLAMTVAFFCICWLPYGLTILIDAKNIPALPKKVFGWLGLSNSAVNFVIYGVMNPVFRKGYRNLFFLLVHCKRARANHLRQKQGSNSDSLYASRRRNSIHSLGKTTKNISGQNIKGLPAQNQLQTNGRPLSMSHSLQRSTYSNGITRSSEKRRSFLQSSVDNRNFQQSSTIYQSDAVRNKTEDQEPSSPHSLQIERLDNEVASRRTKSETDCRVTR